MADGQITTDFKPVREIEEGIITEFKPVKEYVPKTFWQKAKPYAEKASEVLYQSTEQAKDIAQGIPEAVGTMASAAGAFPLSLLEGLGRVVKGFSEGKVDWEEVRKAQERVLEIGTYQPKTQFGKTITQVVASPFTAYQAGIEKLVEKMPPEQQAKYKYLGDLALILVPATLKKAGQLIDMGEAWKAGKAEVPASNKIATAIGKPGEPVLLDKMGFKTETEKIKQIVNDEVKSKLDASKAFEKRDPAYSHELKAEAFKKAGEILEADGPTTEQVVREAITKEVPRVAKEIPTQAEEIKKPGFVPIKEATFKTYEEAKKHETSELKPIQGTEGWTLQPTEIKEVKPKPTQKDMFGVVEGTMQGKIPTKEVDEFPLGKAVEEAKARKVETEMAGKQEELTENMMVWGFKGEKAEVPKYLVENYRKAQKKGRIQRITDAKKYIDKSAGFPVAGWEPVTTATRIPQPTNIITWIKSKGGIDYLKEEWGGEIDIAMENQPTLKSAVNIKGGGLTLDELAMRAKAEGWIQEATPQALLDAVERKKIKPSIMEERIGRKGVGAIAAGSLAFESNLPKYAVNINLERIDNTYSIKKMILDISDRYASDIGEARRGKISLEETRKMADTLSMSEGKLLKRRKGKAFNAEEALAARDILNASAQRLRDVQIKAADLGTEEALATFRMAMEHHAAIQAEVSGMTAEAGRALSSFRIMSKARQSKSYKAMLDAVGGRELNEEILKRFAQIDPNNITAVNKFIRDVTKAKTSDMVYEAWISAILSGPKTHIVNLTSNALTFLTKPTLESPIASTIEAIRRSTTGKPRERFFGEIPYQVFGSWVGLKEGVRAALKAWETELPVEVGEKIEVKVHKAIPSKIFRAGKEKKTIDLFGQKIKIPLTGELEIGGKQVRIPLRALTAADEFGKSLIYSSEIYSQAYRKARKEGLKDEALADRIADLVKEPTSEMLESARKEARYRTFNQPLGRIGNTLMSLRNSVPLLKYVIPFMRTPANIAKFALERTPLNFIRLIDKVRKGEITESQISEEFAKPIMGTLIAGAVVALVKEGSITGAGPKDKEDREALYRIGWQPYSFKIEDKYWSYARLEPIGSVVGMSADFGEMFAGTEEDTEVANKVVYSFTRNIASKTFLSGLTNALDAISDPQRYGEKWVTQFAGSVVPTGVAQYTQATDEVLRRAETPGEKIKSRIPGVAETLLPKRDIWGREIKKEGSVLQKLLSPVYVSTEKPDLVDQEIIRNKVSVGMPAKKISGIELTPDEYDEYSEKAGKRARRIVEKIVKTSSYHLQRNEIKKLRIENAIKSARIAEGSQILKRMAKARRLKPIHEKYGIENNNVPANK